WGHVFLREPRAALTAALHSRRDTSVAEIVELQRAVELGAAQQRDRRLQLVALLAGDPYLLALQARLHLELRVLDGAHDLASRLLVDAVPQRHFLVRGRERRLRFLHLETAEIDAALGEAELHDFEHLPELKVHLR